MFILGKVFNSMNVTDTEKTPQAQQYNIRKEIVESLQQQNNGNDESKVTQYMKVKVLFIQLIFNILL